MTTIKQKSLATLARVEDDVPEIARDHLDLLKAVNPKVWDDKDHKYLEGILYSGIRHLRKNVMETRKVRGGEAFTQGYASLNIILHCYSQERPIVAVGITPTNKEYGLGY